MSTLGRDTDYAREHHQKGSGAAHDPEAWRKYSFTAAELKVQTFPPVSFVVPGIIPEGLSILAGRPKIGKSWAALDTALGVAGDQPVMGGIHPTLGDVLYCALEDNKRRLKRRISKLLAGREWPHRLTLATQWRRLDAGGAEDIISWCKAAPSPALVILDTLASVRPDRAARDTSYEGDYRALEEVHRFTGEKAIGAIALHHTRKMEADDPFDTISGTLGLIGCADTGLVLARGGQGTSLYIRGRDVEESEHAIIFNKDTCRWSILGEAAEVRRSDTRNKILAALLEAKSEMAPQDLAHATNIAVNTIHQRLPGMLADGEVIQLRKGKYCHPSCAENLRAEEGRKGSHKGGNGLH
jgi:hypothetical protein